MTTTSGCSRSASSTASAQFGGGLLPQLADLPEEGPRPVRVTAQDPLRPAGLQDHEAHGVGHGVVQLPGDPAAFLRLGAGRGEAGAQGALRHAPAHPPAEPVDHHVHEGQDHRHERHRRGAS